MHRRILRIWVPRGADPRAQIAISRRMSAVLGAAFLALAMFWMLAGPSGSATALALLFAVTGVGCSLGGLFGGGRKRSATAKRLERRDERLARILAKPPAATRLPHRVLEHALREAEASPLDAAVRQFVESTLRDLKPGDVILIDGPRGIGAVWPKPTDRAFEPIRLPDKESTQRLDDWNMEAWGQPGRWVNPETGLPIDRAALARSEQRAWWRRGTTWAIGVFLLVCLAGCLGGTVYLLLKAAYAAAMGSAAAAAGLLGILALVCGPPLVRRVMLGRITYLVPGGVIHARQPFWGPRAEFTCLRAAETGLVVDWTREAALGFSPAGVDQTVMDWTALIAWLSTARTPTDAEIHTLLNPHQ